MFESRVVGLPESPDTEMPVVRVSVCRVAGVSGRQGTARKSVVCQDIRTRKRLLSGCRIAGGGRTLRHRNARVRGFGVSGYLGYPDIGAQEHKGSGGGWDYRPPK